MRNVLALASLLALAACASPSHWEKPGTDEAATGRDNAECRRAAQQEAFRYYYPPFPIYSGPWGWRRPNYFLWQSDFESNRFIAENRLAAFCMRSRGYELVSSQPRTQAPAAPPSPTDK